jgi:DNA-binding IclR family transcriptional regulator
MSNNSKQSINNRFLLSLTEEKIYAELATRPQSIVQLSRDLDLAPWQIFRAVHELNQLGRVAYLPSRGHWIVTN